jgi:hypothetical protein
MLKIEVDGGNCEAFQRLSASFVDTVTRICIGEYIRQSEMFTDYSALPSTPNSVPFITKPNFVARKISFRLPDF